MILTSYPSHHILIESIMIPRNEGKPEVYNNRSHALVTIRRTFTEGSTGESASEMVIFESTSRTIYDVVADIDGVIPIFLLFRIDCLKRKSV